MIASPTLTPAVAANLLEFMSLRTGISNLRYGGEPAPITDGWESYIYRFQLQRTPCLRDELAGPLILRIYSSLQGLGRLQHEFAAQECMSKLQYPVARPLLLEEGLRVFGGPFMIMEAIPGRTLLELLLSRPWRLWGAPAQMAEAHARLHLLPAEEFPAPSEPFLSRRLEEMAGLIKDCELRAMKPGLDWLTRQRPPEPDSPSIIHLDFHPLNLIFHEDVCRGVLDWSESDVGDRHADIAATIVLFQSAPVPLPTVLAPLAVWPGRGMLFRRYLRAYCRRLPLDKHRLAYYVAWAAFRRLCNWGQWLCAGPSSTGSKPSCIRHVSSNQVNILRRCFWKLSGVAIDL